MIKLPDVFVVVQGCKDRDATPVMDALRREGYPPTLIADQSDFYKVKNEWKLKGNYDNFRAMFTAAMAQEKEWLVTVQDDVSFAPGLIDKIRYILAHTTGGSLSFYNPTNKTYREATKRGKHVVETGENFWGQCFAFHKSLLPELYKWGTDHVILGVNGDDAYLAKFNYWTKKKTRVIVPSLVQHTGFNESVLGTAGKVGQYDRTSETYDPEFDPTTVDWFENFSNPYKDGSQRRDMTGLIGLP